MTEHPVTAHLEDAHLLAALQEARATVDELERMGARTSVAAWFDCTLTLLRFLDLPHCIPPRAPTL